ncbi:MAG: tetratricopeptide repeat protein [Pseudomonadota bacterium]
MRTALLATTTFILGAAAIHGPVLAAGSGDASDTPTCNAGQVYDDTQAKCVSTDKQSLNDDQLLQNGRALAYADRFDEAVNVLNMISDKNSAEVQNYLGYATRKAGDLDKGLAHYRMALAINPDYTLARSYMGVALLQKGDNRGALQQMVEIEKRVGTGSREYTLLFDAVAKATNGQQIDY